MMTMAQRALALALLACPALAAAIPVQFGTGTFVTARTCTGPGGSCSNLSPIVTSMYGGEPGGTRATAAQTLPLFGSTTADAALSGEAGAPILRLAADSLDAMRVNTNTFALQRYTYTGAVSTTRNFGGVLDYTQFITDPNNALYGAAASGISAQLWAFSTLQAQVEAGETAQSNYENLFSFALDGAASGYSLIGESTYNDYDDAAAGFASLNVSVELDPGESIWVMAFLQTPAADGSWIDAMSTFITGWDNSADLIPAAIDVPEPGSTALLALALAALLLSRRKRDALA